MATVTSLTEEKIQELTAGWVGVALSQDEINALVQQLWTSQETATANLEHFQTVVLPQLADDLAAGSIRVSELNDTTIPDLEAQLAQHDLNLENLTTVAIPALQTELDSANSWFFTLEEETFPALDAQITDLDTRLTDFINAGGGGFDPTDLNNAIAALEGRFPIETVDIADDAITADKILARTITALEILADTITANEIAADTITANEIASHTITAAEIFADTITANEIAADTITANEIASRTITALEVAADTLTANEIAADTITANEMAADSITTNELAAGAVTATEIAANTITANEIATDAITADEIAANTITANEVATDILIANELYSREGYFGIIEATQINSGAIDAELGLLGKLQVGEITIDKENGIAVPGPNGLTLLSASGTGHRFAGAVDTDEVTINGGLIVNAANNTINGQIKLSNVVIPPEQPVAISRYWPYTTPIGADTLGMTDSHDGTKWVAINNNDRSVRTYLKTTGAQVDKYPEEYWHHDYVCYNIARVGNYYFMVMWKQSAAEWWLCRVGNLFGSFTALEKIVAYGNVGIPAVGPNLLNGNVVVCYAATDDVSMRYIEYTQAGVEVAGTSSLWNSVYDTSTGAKAVGDKTWALGIARGNLGFSEEDAVITCFGNWIQIWSPASKTIVNWPGRPEAVKGFCVEYGTTDKIRWLGYNTYRIYEFVREAKWGPLHDITYSWFDSKLAGSGKHETTPAPPVAYTGAWKWAALQLDAAAPSNTGQDDSPDSVVYYIDNNRQPEVPVGKSSNIIRGKTASGIPAKTENEFAGAAAYPGSIKSDATLVDGITPRFLVRGDGQGNWGDLQVDGFGKATIGGDTGWIPVTLFTNLWENYGSTWPAVAYRKIGSRVFLRGLIRGSGGLTGTMFNLPVGFRPIVNVMLPAVVAQVTNEYSATGDNPAAFTTGSANSHTHSANPPQMDVRTTVTITNPVSRVDITTAGDVKHSGGSDFASGANWVNLTGMSFFVD